MTAAAEAGVMTDRAAEAVMLARETAAQRNEIGAMIGAVAEWADDALAGGKPPKWIVQRMVIANRLIAAAARGEAPAI
jgi:hypothetical protein